MSKRSTITKIDAVAVVSGLVDLISEQLMEGKIIKLGNLGAFRLSFNSNGEETSDEVDAKSIKKVKVLFRPASFFQRALATVNLQKVKSDKEEGSDEKTQVSNKKNK